MNLNENIDCKTFRKKNIQALGPGKEFLDLTPNAFIKGKIDKLKFIKI